MYNLTSGLIPAAVPFVFRSSLSLAGNMGRVTWVTLFYQIPCTTEQQKRIKAKRICSDDFRTTNIADICQLERTPATMQQRAPRQYSYPSTDIDVSVFLAEKRRLEQHNMDDN